MRRWDIHANNEPLQKAWAREYGIRVEEPLGALQFWLMKVEQANGMALKTPLRYLKPLFSPMLRPLDSRHTWFYEILEAQVRHFTPEVLLNQAMDGIRVDFL